MIKAIEKLNIGVEEEYQLIDPKTRELTSYVTELLDEGALVSENDIKPELLQSQIEIGSNVCDTVEDLEKDLSRLRLLIKKYANKKYQSYSEIHMSFENDHQSPLGNLR